MQKLSESEIEEHIHQADGWRRADEKFILKKYRFKEFLSAIDFVNKVADLAEHTFHHHPFFSIDYKVVTLKMTSWSAGGLTELDFTCARAFDEAYDTSQSP